MPFNRDKQFVVKIMSGGVKQATLRFPTDEEWCERASQVRTIRHILGRGQSKTEYPDAERAASELFDKVLISAGEYSGAEKMQFIARLEKAEVLSVEQLADQFRIEMDVAGATVVHWLKIPTAKQSMDYGKAAIHRTDARRQQITKTRLEPAGTLFDEIAVKTEGYDGSVPIIHKDVAIVELLSTLNADDESPEG